VPKVVVERGPDGSLVLREQRPDEAADESSVVAVAPSRQDIESPEEKHARLQLEWETSMADPIIFQYVIKLLLLLLTHPPYFCPGTGARGATGAARVPSMRRSM